MRSARLREFRISHRPDASLSRGLGVHQSLLPRPLKKLACGACTGLPGNWLRLDRDERDRGGIIGVPDVPSGLPMDPQDTVRQCRFSVQRPGHIPYG